MLDYSVYLVYRAGVWVLARLPLPLLFGWGQAAGAIGWFFASKYRRLALHNVRIAFASKLTSDEQRRIVRRHFARLGANLLCSLKFAHMPATEIFRHVQVEGADHISRCLGDKRPLVLLLSHLGSWELCAQLLPHFIPDRRRSTIYQPIRNRWIDAHVRAARSRFGIEVFDRNEGFGRALALLREGGAIGILADQHAGDSGLWAPFFDRLASTTPLPALLAKRTGARLIAFAVVTEGFARWRAVFEPPLDDLESSVNSLTAQGNRLIEEQVRRAPADWFWVHNRWKTPNPEFLLANYKRGVFVPDDATGLQRFRILIRSSNWLGDAIMSVPAVRAMKRGRPDAHITVAAPEKIAAVWRQVSEVDEVLPLASKSVLGVARLYRSRPQFDVAVLFPKSLRSALEVCFAGVPRCAGSAGHARRWLLQQVVPGKQPRGIEHQTAEYLRLAASFGAETSDALGFDPPLRPAQADLRLALCPGAEYGPAKRWLPERFAAAANEISHQTGALWLLFGTARDAESGRLVAERLKGPHENRIGQTTLEQLIEELRHCHLLLTNDTGTMHLAALLGLPTVSIFGSTEPRRSAPLGPGHRILRHHVECSPCFLRECPLDFRCMRAVTSAEVIAAVLQTLPPAMRDRVPTLR